MKDVAKLVMLVAALTTAESGLASAEAGTITWHWTGPVTGYVSDWCGGPCDPSLSEVVPLGSVVDVIVSLDPVVPSFSNFSETCLWGMATASLQVVGQTFTNSGYIWVDAMGFGPGLCSSSFDHVEIVIPGWGYNEALADGWVNFSYSYLPGLWWGGDLTTVQPASIGAQFPMFYRPMQSAPQRFTASLQAVPDLQPVPEPATWLLFSTGLAAAAWRRRRR